MEAKGLVPDEISVTAQSVLNTWEDLGAQADEVAKMMHATCAKGCAGCCYLLAIISFADAVLIAVHLLDTGTWESWLPRLREKALQLAQLSGKQVSLAQFRELYFDAKIPCAFLDQKTSLCAVYRHRPLPCRAHYVVTDPVLCLPEAKGAKVGQIDLRQLDAVGIDVARQLSAEADFCAGPIPLAVLFTLGIVLKQRHRVEDIEKLEPLIADLPSPAEWMKGAVRQMDLVSDGGRGADPRSPST